jgi:hypothetical protein
MTEEASRGLAEVSMERRLPVGWALVRTAFEGETPALRPASRPDAVLHRWTGWAAPDGTLI